MNHRSREGRGFSILELVCALAVAGVTLPLLLRLWVASHRALEHAQQSSSWTVRAADVASLFRRDVRAASRVRLSRNGRVLECRTPGSRVRWSVGPDGLRRAEGMGRPQVVLESVTATLGVARQGTLVTLAIVTDDGVVLRVSAAPRNGGRSP